jgi:hypothetical protein
MPADLVAITHDDCVELVIEESAETILAAQKAKRFGFDSRFEGYGHNGTKLFEEMGDLYASIEALLSWYPAERHPDLRAAFEKARRTKMQRALHAKAELMERSK